MGCWNGTCAISQLPIRVHDPVRVMLIAIDPRPDSDFHTGYCYATGIAYPLTPPVLGEYDDYGGATVANPDEVSLFAFGKMGIDLTKIDDGDLQTVLRDEAPVFKTYFGTAKVGLWMAHEAVYQHMMQHIREVESWGARGLDWATLRDMADKVCDEMAEAAAKVRSAGAADLMSDVEQRMAMRFWSGFHRYGQEIGLEMMWERQTIGLRSGFQNITMKMSDMVWKGATREEMLPFCYAVADIIRLNEAMEATRRGFWTQSGAGSQSEDLEAHLSLAKCIAEVAETTIRKRKEEDAEWADEDEAEAESP